MPKRPAGLPRRAVVDTSSASRSRDCVHLRRVDPGALAHPGNRVEVVNQGLPVQGPNVLADDGPSSIARISTRGTRSNPAALGQVLARTSRSRETSVGGEGWGSDDSTAPGPVTETEDRAHRVHSA